MKKGLLFGALAAVILAGCGSASPLLDWAPCTDAQIGITECDGATAYVCETSNTPGKNTWQHNGECLRTDTQGEKCDLEGLDECSNGRHLLCVTFGATYHGALIPSQHPGELSWVDAGGCGLVR